VTRSSNDPASRFFAWKATHPAEAEHLDQVPPDVVGRLWNDAWKAGAWDALQRNATLGINLSQIIERLEELAQLYSDVERDRAYERELQQASAYWRGEDDA
jgi:hypothetical protein